MKKKFEEYLKEKGLLELYLDGGLKGDKLTKEKDNHRKEYEKDYQKAWIENNKRVGVSLSKESNNNEYEYLKKRADKANKKLGAYIKECALAYLKKKYVVENQTQIDNLIRELSLLRETRNKEGRNLQNLLYQLINRGYPVDKEVFELKEMLYNQKKIDEEFKLVDMVKDRLEQKPLELLPYLKEELQKSPELKKQIQTLLKE